MLDLLHEYAVSRGLVAEVGFKAKTARRIITIAADGHVGVIPPEPKGKDFSFERCPDLTQSEMVALGGRATHPLLSECSSVVLLTDKEEVEPDDKQKAKHAFFVERIKEVAEVVPAFAPVAVALSSPETLAEMRTRLHREKAKPTDKVTFFVNGAYPIDLPDWWDWWRTRRAELVGDAMAKSGKKKSGEAAEQMVCFVTGLPTVPLRVHPKITGLGDVGGQAQVPFVGFDKEAFRSYGLEQSANAAVSEDAAYGYRAALDDLLKRSESLAGMRIAHWFNEPVPPADDVFRFLYEEVEPEDAEEAEDMEEANKTTERSALQALEKTLHRLKKDDGWQKLAAYRYYALSLSGAGGRVMVRDWTTGTFEELANSVERWFRDFDIVSLSTGKVPQPVLWRVMKAILAPEETGTKALGTIKVPLWKAALDCSRPIPDAALNRILNLHRSYIVTGGLDNRSSKTTPATLHLRMGLMKAWLIRKGNPKNPMEKMEKEVNPAYPSSAYHCGRLVAMLASLQRAALPEVDAGVAQRYYGAASVTPRLVVGRLTRLAQHHVAKVASDRKGLAYWYETRIGAIVTELNEAARLAGTDGLPATFSTQQQTEFALGYYQQIAENRTKKPNTVTDPNEVSPENETTPTGSTL